MSPKELLKLIEKGLKTLTINFEDDSWRSFVPSMPGWYFIETNTPPVVLKGIGPPKGEAHYDIPKRVNFSLWPELLGLCILPSKNPFYFVYSGEAKNLKARAREHISGHPKTGCLALSNYSIFHTYKWRFHFSPCHFGENPRESKLLRLFGEQIWRSKYGWPILCGR